MSFIIEENIEQYAAQHTKSEPDSLTALAEQTHAEMEMPQMLTGRLEGRFLKMLVQMNQPKLIVEVGTFTGYSALSMAEGLPTEGKIITCDINPKAQKVAQAAFDNSPHGNKIELRMGAASETIQQITDTIDMVFIDADKENYIHYYELLISRLKIGGIMVLDNMLWGGSVLQPKDEETHTLNRLNKLICDDHRVENVLLTVRDGIQLVRKIHN